MIKKAIAILLCVGLLLSGTTVTVFGEAKVSAKLIQMEGDVQVVRAGGEKPFKAFLKMRLTEGDRIITGPTGTAKIEMDDEVVITLAENTKIYLSELRGSKGAQQSSINLQSGGVGSSVKKKLKENSRFEIKTPTAVMGVRGTEFFTQYFNGNVDVRVVDGVVEVKVSVTKAGEVTDFGAVGVQTYSFPVSALKQVSFGEGVSAGNLPDSVESLNLQGLPIPFLDRVREINQQNPEAIPQNIIDTIDEAVNSAVLAMQNRMNSVDLAPDELSSVIEGAIAGNIQTAIPASAPTRVQTSPPSLPDTSNRDRGDREDRTPSRPKAVFDFVYGDDLNPVKIEFEINDSPYDFIDCILSSDIQAISYTVSSSNESVATAEINAEVTNQVIIKDLSPGTTVISITGSASGYESFGRAINLEVKEKIIATYTLTLNGEGLTSELDVEGTEGQDGEIIYVGIGKDTVVMITVEVPQGKELATFTVNDLDKKADLEENDCMYIFSITEDTIVEVTYEETPALEAVFNIEYWELDANEATINPTAIEHRIYDSAYDFIDCILSSDIQAISYTVSSSNESVATAEINAEVTNQVIIKDLSPGTTVISITGYADGYEPFTRTINLEVK
ncbi:MAG: FecR domain-containing protein [Lutispora sp.]|nr:FecR domain-containing protein [Lutispora sp.]